MMRDKTIDLSIIQTIPDGATVMVGGFGVPGTPFMLLEALADHGAKELTIIKNDANEANMGVDWLLSNGQVKRLIVSHIGLNRQAIQGMNAGAVAVEFVPQGILAERIRAAGAGLLGIVSDIGLGTEDATSAQYATATQGASGKHVLTVAGQEAVFEAALSADFALLHAEQGDSTGNLVYASSARNFNPLMAMAAKVTIAEVEQRLALGGLAAEHIHTPAPFIDHLVLMPTVMEVYHVVQR